MAEAHSTADQGLDVIAEAIAARFDALNWAHYQDSDHKQRDPVRKTVLNIRRDLLTLGEADLPLAAKIWDEHVPAFVPRPPEFDNPPERHDVLNAISPGRRKRRLSTEPWLEERPARDSADKRTTPDLFSEQDTQEPDGRSEKGASEPAPDADDPNAARLRLLRDGLLKQYHQADEKYHFRDPEGEVAFEAQARRIITSHETPGVVSSMIDLAEINDWSSIKVSGTLAFRQEAWLQASLRGLEVTGHRPSKLDLARLEDLRNEFGPERARTNAVIDRTQGHDPKHKYVTRAQDNPPIEPPPKLLIGQKALVDSLEGAMRARGDSERAIAMARETAAEKLGKGRIHVGRLVSVGYAPYMNTPGEAQSAYVVLENDKGQSSKIWGVDLPRALKAGAVQKGDKVALAFRGRHMVTVSVKVANESGKGFHYEKRDVERNTWEAVKFDRLRAAARDKVLAAAKLTRTQTTRTPNSNTGPSKARPHRQGRERLR